MGPTDLTPLSPSPQRTSAKLSKLGGRKLSVIPTGLHGQQVVLGFYLNCLEQQQVLMEASVLSPRDWRNYTIFRASRGSALGVRNLEWYPSENSSSGAATATLLQLCLTSALKP